MKNGKLRVHEKEFPVKLEDGYYIIRKLYPVECERLQTMPDGYTDGISNTQRYKCLGNGWTAAVIEHILQDGIGHLDRDTPLQVLSLYDGIATGRYVLNKMGFWNIEYRAYEIDKFAIQVAKRNWPDIVECGDAFAVRRKLEGNDDLFC